MTRYSRSHLDDQSLKLRRRTGAGGERSATADFLADIAEFDARKLYVPAGYGSMYEYCLRELRLSEDAAFLRIRAARVARQLPEIFPALAEGRLNLTAVYRLSRHLIDENGQRVPGAQELLAAAMDKTKAELELLIAERFPRPGVPSRLEGSPVPERVKGGGAATGSPVPERVDGGVDAPRPRVAPLSAESYEMQVTISRAIHEKIRYAQTLLGHSVPTSELAASIERAYDALIAQLEKQKFAKTSRPGPVRSSVDPRHVPADVKRKVWARDGGQCTFVGEGGHRCGAVVRLHFDHIDPVARGGIATEDTIRLRCHAHNQYEAELIFGAGFMEKKREAARQAAAEKRAQAAIEKDPDRSIVPWLKHMGVRLEDARRAEEFCRTLPPEATLEERIRAALRFLSSSRCRIEKPGTAA